MKVKIYIEKEDFENFFLWVNRLRQGILSSPTVNYSTVEKGIKNPLQLSLDAEMYNLVQDALADIETIGDNYGDMELDFQPLSRSWELRTIGDIVRSSTRYDMASNVIYTALCAISQIPGLSPAEAMIIAEREWVGSPQAQEDPDI